MRIVMTPGWDRKVLAAADPKMWRVAKRVEQNATVNILRGGHVRTGALLNSLHTSRVKLAHYRVWIGTDHWHFIEYGTSPHMIYPKRWGYLKFQVKGRTVYARSVRHPGNPEYSVMRRALR